MGVNRALIFGMSGCEEGRRDGTFKVAPARLPALLEAPFFLLPLWEKVARTKSVPDEGSASAERDPSPALASLGHPLPQGEREKLTPPPRIAARACAGAWKNCHPKPWSARWHRPASHGRRCVPC